MKSYRLYMKVVLAAVLLFAVGCQKHDVFAPDEAQTNQLRFNASIGAAQTATRAAESDNNVLKIASSAGVKPPHIVIHTYTGTPGSSMASYFSDELGYFKTGDYWDVNSGKQRFLPQGGMNLYAYFATDFADKGNLDNVTYYPPVLPTDSPKLSYTVTKDDALLQLDLIAAKVENVSTPNILIPFRHVLSQINFGVKGIDRHKVMIKNIRINNICGKGTFDYNSWMWNMDNSVIHTYPYYFPDRVERVGTSGLGDNYYTQGAADDSKNTYIFGDGSKFGPGDANTIFYAQTDPTLSNYKIRANTSEPLHNSLMLIPQEIKQNPNATVTFDYEINIDGRTIRSGVNSVVRLDPYYDWKPNLRYVYLFDFSDPSEKITFDVLLAPWENWDSDGDNTGIKNGTIQQPTANTLNTAGDGETIYLLGLLERNLVWDWRDGSKYTFANINTLTLDFSGVETRNYSVQVIVPTGFTLAGNNPSNGGKLTIIRSTPILLEPTERQLNISKSGSTIILHGELSGNLAWNWQAIAFASLKQNEAFTLDFTDVNFSGRTITLTLPIDVSAAGAGVTGSNPYILSGNTKVTITNNQVDGVKKPSPFILDVVTSQTEIGINGGNVASGGDIWDWRDYAFTSLDSQESFYLNFSGVIFNGQQINIQLPPGFRGTGGSKTNQNNFAVSDNDIITIKNNRINYPAPAQVQGVSGGGIIALAGETLQSEALLDWRSYSFANFLPQTSFTFDVNSVDFFYPLQLALPAYFTLSGGTGVNSLVAGTYSFTQPTSVQILNNRVPRPTVIQLDMMGNGNVLNVNGGKVYDNEVWDWKAVPFSSLGGSGKSFTLVFQNIDFNSNYIEINLSGLTASGAGVANPSNGVYRINTNTSVVISDTRITRSVTGGQPLLTDVVAGQRVVLTGTVASSQLWSWALMPNLNPGEWFEIDYSQTNAAGGNYIQLPVAEAPYSLEGDYDNTNIAYYRFYKRGASTNGIVRFTRNMIVPTSTELNALANGGSISVGGKLVSSTTWDWGYVPFVNFTGKRTNEYFDLDLTGVDFGSNKVTLLLAGFNVVKQSGSGTVTYTFDATNGPSYTIDGPGKYRITDVSYTMNATNAAQICNVTNGNVIAFSGYTVVANQQFTISPAKALAITGSGQKIYIDFRRIKYNTNDRFIIVNTNYFSGYTPTSLYGTSGRITFPSSSQLGAYSRSSGTLLGEIAIITKN